MVVHIAPKIPNFTNDIVDVLCGDTDASSAVTCKYDDTNYHKNPTCPECILLAMAEPELVGTLDDYRGR